MKLTWLSKPFTWAWQRVVYCDEWNAFKGYFSDLTRQNEHAECRHFKQVLVSKHDTWNVTGLLVRFENSNIFYRFGMR